MYLFGFEAETHSLHSSELNHSLVMPQGRLTGGSPSAVERCMGGDQPGAT